MFDYDIKTILLVKLDMENEKATISAGTYNSSGDINYANVRKTPSGNRTAELTYEELEVTLREKIGTYSSRYARLKVNRNTLEGSFHTEFDNEPCVGISVSSSISWGEGSLITADEYNEIFAEIYRKSDELDREYDELKKSTRKF